MKYYVLEDGWDVEVYEDKEKAIYAYDLYFDRLTESEKKKIEYFRLYEIESDVHPDKIEGDLIDYLTEMIKCFK